MKQQGRNWNCLAAVLVGCGAVQAGSSASVSQQTGLAVQSAEESTPYSEKKGEPLPLPDTDEAVKALNGQIGEPVWDFFDARF